ncbi:mechanosensitive ion channel family protein [Anaerovorax odorimutans]|uniref:mechanosensitive ion channel family protein n=1 Tax=Anaerovorax odorimutans TaxID=109327 RepID=UPI000426304B|nr:mechanosensitive ion channel domain-containing protein [Anaerovorax odorimutans]
MPEKYMNLLIKIGIVALILIVGYIAIKIVCKIVKKALVKSGLDEVIHTFIINCIKVILWIVVLITALSKMGIPPTAFLTVLGAAGIAVALALQNSLSNFAGGILIICTKPYRKGDYIEDYETAGKVEKIDLLYTTLITFDNKIITIPNGKLANSTVVNYSKAENRRVDCNFQISYGDDIDKAKDILRSVAVSNYKVFKDEDIVIGVSGHNDSSIGIDLKVWCKTEDYWDVKYYLEEKVKLAFDEAGISIPFPQLDVNLKK